MHNYVNETQAESWATSAAGHSNPHWPELSPEELLADNLNADRLTHDDKSVLNFEPDNEDEHLLHHRHTGAEHGSLLAHELSSFEVDQATAGSVQSAVVCLYGSHALARWAWRTWEFAVVLILVRVSPPSSSMLLVSAYGLLDNLVRLLLGPLVGPYIDRSDLIKGAISCYGMQNLCIAVSAAAAGLLVWLQQHQHAAAATQTTYYWALLSTTVVAGASSSIGSLGAAVSVETHCPAALCGGNAAALGKVNAAMRAIDLTCQMMAPMAAGFLMTYGGMLIAIAVISVYCMLVWLPEVVLLHAAQTRSHLLRQPKQRQPHTPTKPHPIATLFGCHAWHVYFAQPTVLAALSLAVLYFTVLSLGFLMTSYLAWRGMSEATLSLFRAAGALSGLSATLLFHPLQRCVGLPGTGAAGITWQLVCLLIGVLPVLLSHMLQQPSMGGANHSRLLFTTEHNITAAVRHSMLSNATSTSSSLSNNDTVHAFVVNAATDAIRTAAVSGSSDSAAVLATGSAAQSKPSTLLYVLLSGLVASRMGLWLFDLSVLQLQQQLVANSQLGTVSGVQASMQSFFEICSFIAGCITYKPEQFHWLMLGSCCTVATAVGLYLLFLWRGGGGVRQYKNMSQQTVVSSVRHFGRSPLGKPDVVYDQLQMDQKGRTGSTELEDNQAVE